VKCAAGAACLLLLGACRKPAPPEPPPAAVEVETAPAVPEGLELLFWSTVAEGASGPLIQLRQTATARNRCHAEVTVGGDKRWAVDQCMATKLYLRFLSSDGERAVVLDPAPEVESGAELDQVALGKIWSHGTVAAVLTPAALRLSGRVRAEGGVARWLGERDQKVLREGIEVQLADGSLRTIRFDGADLAAPPKPRVSAMPAAVQSCNPCSYTDDSGTYHVVESAEEIPLKFRRNAARVRPVENRADAAPVLAAPVPAAAGLDPAPFGQQPPTHEPTRAELEKAEAAEVERMKAKREATPLREKDHFERVHDMLAPGTVYDPERKIKCVKPGGEEIPCLN
jgi:hypothetical protein